MTQNQLRLREVREVERNNRVKEAIDRFKADIESGKLEETIQNNLRNYKINLDKNTIQRLANDQLDARERSKIAEAIRNDLAKEIETNRSNLANEEIKRVLNSVKALKAKYSVGSILGAIFGLMPKEEMLNLYGLDINDFPKMWETLFGSSSEPSYGDKKRAQLGYGGQTSNPEKEKTWRDKLSWEDRKPIDEQATNSQKSRDGGGTRVSGHSKSNKKDDENEIPIDFSSSRGPGKVEYKQGPPISVPNANYSSDAPKTQTLSEQPSYSGGHVSKGYISGGIFTPNANYQGG